MKPLRILFCGFRHGHIHALYKRVAATTDCRIVACIEPNAEARAAAEAALGITMSDIPYDAFLASDEVDVVAVGCAYGDRADIILRALRAGKHVLADKPICTSREQLEEIARTARERSLNVGCMLDLRYLPQTRRAAELLDGRYGKVQSVLFNGQHCIDYAHRPTWYFEEGMHGGTINDLAIHGVDLTRMQTKKEFTKVDAARTWNAFANKHLHFKDCAMFMARLDGGVGVLADVSYSAPSQVFSMPTYWEFRIFCDKALVTFHYTDSTVTVYEEGVAESQVFDGIAGGDYLDEFMEAVETGDLSMLENVVASTAAALTLQEAADAEVNV